MCFKLATLALDVKGISPTDMLILAQIGKYADMNTKTCYPSQSRIAKDCGFSRPRVNIGFQTLKKLGLISDAQDGKILVNLGASVIVDDTKDVIVDNTPVILNYTPVIVDDTSVIVDDTNNKSFNNLSNNKKNKTKKVIADLETEPIPKQKKIASRLDENWQPTQANLDYAKLKGVPDGRIEHEIEGFKDYWLSKAKSNTSVDWSRNWQTWCRNAVEWHYSGNAKQTGFTGTKPNGAGTASRASAGLQMLSEMADDYSARRARNGI